MLKRLPGVRHLQGAGLGTQRSAKQTRLLPWRDARSGRQTVSEQIKDKRKWGDGWGWPEGLRGLQEGHVQEAGKCRGGRTGAELQPSPRSRVARPNPPSNSRLLSEALGKQASSQMLATAP